MTKDKVNVLVGGGAGQGLVTVGYILTKSCARAGFSIVVTQDYMSRIRGGHNTYAIRISADGVAAPQEAVDLLIALNNETVNLHCSEVLPGGVIIASSEFPEGKDPRVQRVPYKEIAPDRQVNIVALGIAAEMLGLEEDLVARTVESHFGKKHKDVEANRTALAKAFTWGKQHHVRSFQQPQRVVNVDKRIALNGNEALALGAIAAGLKFAAFYPMTPSTSISLTLIQHAKQMGLVVEQAEDEIAAINMALGASYAGVPSMVATSGGGFALMVEGVSLAGMTETPIVIVVGQRPAPATGLPTRTEQSELEFILHAGHGEFPRAIFAPATVEECFHLARRAFELAEKVQAPIFILTDQFLADSYRAVAPFAVDGLKPVVPGADADSVPKPYKRFAITDSGVSPRLLPGMSKNLVVVDSDEHTEDGHITEDLSIRKRMVEKRLRKVDILRGESIPPTCDGEEKPETLLVSWGSTKGSVEEAAAHLRSRGRSVATMHFSQVWPLVSEKYLYRLQNAGQVICIEGNATGQFGRVIRRETGFTIEKSVHRYDGLPITPEYILREIKL
jgi:2-oxoglutarate ferredoxin oxidoreductase subunit alpha